MAQWCNPLILQPEQSDGVSSIPGGTPPLECHDKGSRTRLAVSYFCDPCAWVKTATSPSLGKFARDFSKLFRVFRRDLLEKILCMIWTG